MRLIILISIGVIYSSYGQVITPGSELWYYHQSIQTESTFQKTKAWNSSIVNFNTDSSQRSHPWKSLYQISQKTKSFQLLPIRFNTSFNSKYPSGANDGAVWEGKGINLNISAGFSYQNDFFRLTFYPVYYFAQNSSFYIPDNRSSAPFNYPFTNRIDWVMAYGNNSYNQFHPGQSEARIVFKKFTLGLSTANETWGPSKMNPIILGNNSAGIPRIGLGTDESVDIKIGLLDTKFIWGLLKESEYYEASSYDKRYLSGVSLAYQPVFLKNLTLGLNRVMYRNWFEDESPFEIDDFAPVMSTFFSFGKEKDTLNGRPVNDLYDQMASITLQWCFPEVGFEAYVEYARNDFSGNLTDFLLEPEHSRGYTIGFVKNIPMDDDALISLGYEHTNLSRSKSYLLRATPPFYQHHIIMHGYTINGQIIGSSIGPGSNTDNVWANYYYPKGGIRLTGSRIRFNDDYFFSQPAANYDDHDVQYSLSLNGTRLIGPYVISAGFEWDHRFNWYYESNLDVNNWKLSLAITRVIGSF